MQVLALLTPGAEPSSEEQAEITPDDFVPARISGIASDVAATGGCGLGEVFVFAVTARPFVVPDVEDGAGLRGRLRFKSPCFDLRAGRATFLADYLLGFFNGRVSGFGEGGGVVGRCEVGT